MFVTEEEPRLYTTTAAAKELGISAVYAKKLRADMKLGKRFGRDWLLTDADLDVMRARNRKPGPKEKARRLIHSDGG